jgi:hypothetical protein
MIWEKTVFLFILFDLTPAPLLSERWDHVEFSLFLALGATQGGG